MADGSRLTVWEDPQIDLRSLSRMITVEDVLHLAAFRRGLPEVVAGHGNLGRPIRWVHSGEVADMASLLKGGELLLTTGMGIGGSPERQRKYVSELAERGVAAIALELGRTFSEPPAALVQEAELRGIPLILLHRGVPWVEITEEIHSRIVDERLALMRGGEDLHRGLTEVLLRRGGIPEILTTLADTISNPVLVDRESEGLLYHAPHHTDDVEVMRAWEGLRGRDLGHGGEAIIEAISDPEELRWGRLIVLSMETPFTPFTLVAVEQAVDVIGLSLLRDHEDDRLWIGERGNFLADLAAGRIGGHEAEDRARALGFDPGTRPVAPLGVRLRLAPAAAEGIATVVWGDVRAELEGTRRPFLMGAAGRDGAEMLLLAALGKSESRESLAEATANLIRRCAVPRVQSNEPVVVAVGPIAVEWRNIQEALRQTAEALAVALHLKPSLWHDAATLRLDGLLWKLRDRDDLMLFVDRMLAPLHTHDASQNPKLVPTLEAFFACGGRKAETARALSLERQSLYHRLSRIEELLGVDLADETTRLSLHLALRARRLLIASERL